MSGGETVAKKKTTVDLEKLEQAIAAAKNMEELTAVMRELEPEIRNQLTHQVYEKTNEIVFGEAG